jgi:hypothetical protein
MIKREASAKLSGAMKEKVDTEQSVGECSSTGDSKPALVEGTDYYLEGGWLVFTAHFLRRRGYCCANGCRHCPYESEAKK